MAVPFRVQAAPDARPGVHLVTFDVTLDGHRYGERFDLKQPASEGVVAMRILPAVSAR